MNRAMKLLLATGIALCALAVESSGKSTIIYGRCRQGECSVIKLLSATLVTKSALGTLYAVLAPSAVSTDPKVPTTFPPPGMPDYVFCSKRKPLVASWSDDTGGKWIVDKLAIGDPSRVSGYNFESHLLYLAVCHGLQPTGGGFGIYSEKLTKKLLALGYQRDWQDSEPDQIRLKSVEELYRLLGLPPQPQSQQNGMQSVAPG